MRVECRCGTLIKHYGNPCAQFADFLPSQSDDDYCEVIENAVKDHPSDPAVASGCVIDGTVRFFRRMCQCAQCGRVYIEDEDYRTHEFTPASAEAPHNLFERRPVNPPAQTADGKSDSN